jgi:ubiquinone/menaquinone biosynthesis C-methylase UbiE
MPKFNDQTYLKNDQYRDASNLNARLALHQRFSTNPQGWFPWIFETLEALPARARVLELGCGTGSLWSTWAERIPSGWSITLSDFSEGMLKNAWSNLVIIGRGFKFEQIDAQSIPYPDESFEIVIANHMLYHVPDRQKALAEIRRVLKPGGFLVATTVGEDHLKEMSGWFEHINADMDLSTGKNPFTLENGQAQLAPFFSQVEIRRYEDNLRISEVPALMAYLRSSSMQAADASDSQLQELEQELERELDLKGEIFVTKDSGLFLATK